MPRLELFYPCRPFIIGQKFGDSLACVEDNNLPITKRKLIAKPADGICPLGFTDLYPVLGMKGHTGMDLYAPDGQPIFYAGPDGFVEEISTEIERGLGLGIVSSDKFTFNDGLEAQAKTRYWHLKISFVKKGDQIKTGQLIALADNTGLSAGSHLHFELKPVLKNAWGEYFNTQQDNGYYGAVDPNPYFTGILAKDASVWNSIKSLTDNLAVRMKVLVELVKLSSKF